MLFHSYVTLAIAKGNITVEVTDDAPLIRAENGDVSTTMVQQQISEVPNPGNDLTYIAQTAPGAVMNTDAQTYGNFSILGNVRIVLSLHHRWN